MCRRLLLLFYLTVAIVSTAEQSNATATETTSTTSPSPAPSSAPTTSEDATTAAPSVPTTTSATAEKLTTKDDVNSNLVTLCDKCMKLVSNTPTADIIASCKESPCVYIEVLRITNETEADVNRFFETKKYSSNSTFSVYIEHSRSIRHLNFGKLPSIKDLRIYNTSLINVTMIANFNINGLAFVHGNVNLTSETRIALKDVSTTEDVQTTESECVVDPMDPVLAFACHEVYGDLVLKNMNLGLELTHETTVHGCLDVRHVVLPYNFFTKMRFEDCNNESVIETCMTHRDKALVERSLRNNYRHVQPPDCKFICSIEDLERNQENCIAFKSLYIDANTPNVHLLQSTTAVMGRITILNRPETLIDYLANVEYITVSSDMNDAGISVLNNSNLEDIVWNKKLIIDTATLGCTASVVKVEGNPKYKLTEEIRQRYLSLARVGSCVQTGLDIDPWDSTGLLPEPVDDPLPAVGQLPDFAFDQIDWEDSIDVMKETPTKKSVNAISTLWFLTFLVLVVLPVLAGFVLGGIRLRRYCCHKKQLWKEIEQTRKKMENRPFPTNLLKFEETLTSSQTRRLFVFLDKIMAIPVLRLRELVAYGVEGGVTELHAMDRQRSLTRVLDNGRNKLNMEHRQKLARMIEEKHAMPVYDLPKQTELDKLYERKNCKKRHDHEQDPIHAYDLFRNNRIYEFSNRPGYSSYRNENKLREIFGIWSKKERQLYTLFGTGPDLINYATRDFKLEEVQSPKGQSDHLDEEMKRAGIETKFYKCEYSRNNKVDKDKSRSFLVEFHNIRLQGLHSLSRNMEVNNDKPFIQLVFLAKLLDAPVICRESEVFFLLKMFHTALFYIYDFFEKTSCETFPLLAAIDIALDELDLFGLSPPDSVHIFALQMIEFCREFLLEKQKTGGFTAVSKVLQSYHTRKSRGPNRADAKAIEAWSRESLDLYVKSTLEVERVVQNHLLFADQLDWKGKLPSEETRGCHYEPVEIAYWRVPFEDYAREMQPSLDVMRKKSQDRVAAYRARVARLEKLMKNCNVRKESYRLMGSQSEAEGKSDSAEEKPLLPSQTNEN